MKKVVAIIVVVSLVALSGAVVGLMLLDGSGRNSDPDREGGRVPRETRTPANAGVTKAPAPGLQRFYDQDVDWEVCDRNDSQDCATLEVPVDYAKPNGETFELNLLRVPAKGTPIGSMLVNPGGPGAPGTTYASMAGFVFRDPLLTNFDIVGFDPRGTGASSPVDCLTDEELDDYVAMDPDPDTPQEVAETEAMAERFATGCEELTGDILGHVSTVEAARDMDVLRAVLGDEQLNYFGASYGTKLGATYAELFPSRVGRLVLDGAVDVGADSQTLSLEQATGFETALTAYVRYCIESSDSCFLGDTVEEGMGRIKRLMEDVEKSPLPAGDRTLEVGNAFYGIVMPLYNRDYWPMLSAALRTALQGQGAGLLSLSDTYASRVGGSYIDNTMEANFVINCLDDPSSVPAEEIPDHFAAFEEASPTFGRVFAWGMLGCSDFPVRTSEKPIEIRGEGAAPILVLGTTRDPATPMKWAEALAKQLDSAVLIERDGDGHTAYNADNDCINRVVEDYLVDGTVPDNPTRC